MSLVRGLNKVLANIAKASLVIPERVAQGLTLAGLDLQATSQKLVPVDTGNLKASAFTRRSGVGSLTKVEVGYTSRYAVWVHEAPMTLEGQPRRGRGGKGKYWDPQGRATNKFLEGPLRDAKNRKRMVAIVRARAGL